MGMAIPAWSPWTVCAAVAPAGMCVVVTAVAMASTTAPADLERAADEAGGESLLVVCNAAERLDIERGVREREARPGSASDARSTA